MLRSMINYTEKAMNVSAKVLDILEKEKCTVYEGLEILEASKLLLKENVTVQISKN